VESGPDSGHATAQPNVPGRGIVAGYGWRFWLIVAALGFVTGIGSGALLKLLNLLEHALWGGSHLTLVRAIEQTSALHRVLVLLAGGLLAGLGALLLRRIKGGAEVSEAL